MTPESPVCTCGAPAAYTQIRPARDVGGELVAIGSCYPDLPLSALDDSLEYCRHVIRRALLSPQDISIGMAYLIAQDKNMLDEFPELVARYQARHGAYRWTKVPSFLPAKFRKST